MVIFWETSTALFLFWGSNSLPKGVLSILGSFPLPRYPSTSTGWGQDLHAVKEQVKERGREEEHGESVISRGSDSGDTLRCNVRPTCPGSRRKFAAWLISISQLSWTAGTAMYVHKRLVLTSSWYICKNILFQTLMLFLLRILCLLFGEENLGLFCFSLWDCYWHWFKVSICLIQGLFWEADWESVSEGNRAISICIQAKLGKTLNYQWWMIPALFCSIQQITNLKGLINSQWGEFLKPSKTNTNEHVYTITYFAYGFSKIY